MSDDAIGRSSSAGGSAVEPMVTSVPGPRRPSSESKRGRAICRSIAGGGAWTAGRAEPREYVAPARETPVSRFRTCVRLRLGSSKPLRGPDQSSIAQSRSRLSAGPLRLPEIGDQLHERLSDRGEVEIEQANEELVWMLGLDVERLQCHRRNLPQVVGDDHLSANLDGGSQDVPIV